MSYGYTEADRMDQSFIVKVIKISWRKIRLYLIALLLLFGFFFLCWGKKRDMSHVEVFEVEIVVFCYLSFGGLHDIKFLNSVDKRYVRKTF